MKSSRLFEITPVIAAAATIVGLISIVLPVGLPWRPQKFRLLELAQVDHQLAIRIHSQHIEQPADLHSNPAFRKILSIPFSSAILLTI